MHERTARYTVAERHALVAEQRQSGLSATAFCREHGLVVTGHLTALLDRAVRV